MRGIHATKPHCGLSLLALGLSLGLALASGAARATPQKTVGVDIGGGVKNVTAADVQVLREILRAAKVDNAEISSMERTPEHQARVMYDLAKDDLASTRELYCSAADAVLDLFDEKKARTEVLARMLSELRRQLPAARELGCLNHVQNPDVYAVDIASSSVPEESVAALVRAGKKAVREGKVVRFLFPPTDKRAFHFEFSKATATK